MPFASCQLLYVLFSIQFFYPLECTRGPPVL